MWYTCHPERRKGGKGSGTLKGRKAILEDEKDPMFGQQIVAGSSRNNGAERGILTNRLV